MFKNEIKEMFNEQNYKDRLKDINQVLSISVSLASGLVWKEKTKSFYEVIARELNEAFDNYLLPDIKLKKVNENYLRINIENNPVIFLKNNLFNSENEYITIDKWLKQELVIIEKKEFPIHLTTEEKEVLYNNSTSEEIEIINRNYNRQELNSSRFLYNSVLGDEEKLTEIFNKNGYYSITIKEYINRLATGKYEYNLNGTDQNINKFKETLNNYILELGAYISKEIEKYVNEII